MPDKLTNEQFDRLCKLFEEANEKGKVGLVSYNAENDEENFLCEGESISPKKVIENIEGMTKAPTL